jgi:hypothetical protein
LIDENVTTAVNLDVVESLVITDLKWKVKK